MPLKISIKMQNPYRDFIYTELLNIKNNPTTVRSNNTARLLTKTSTNPSLTLIPIQNFYQS
jgi:hypothetical protein